MQNQNTSYYTSNNKFMYIVYTILKVCVSVILAIAIAHTDYFTDAAMRYDAPVRHIFGKVRLLYLGQSQFFSRGQLYCFHIVVFKV